MLFEQQRTSLRRERKGDSSTKSKSEDEKRIHGHRHGQTSGSGNELRLTERKKALRCVSKSNTRDVTCRKSKTLILETNLEK